MKLLFTLIAATFAVVSYTAAADDDAPNAKPAAGSMGAEALALAAK
jgi:hypothetical protein